MNQSIKYYYFLFLIAIVCGILTLGMISVLAMIIGLMILRQTMIAQVFNPLFETTTKILDFLNGKYSYNFDSPEENNYLSYIQNYSNIF